MLTRISIEFPDTPCQLNCDQFNCVKSTASRRAAKSADIGAPVGDPGQHRTQHVARRYLRRYATARAPLPFKERADCPNRTPSRATIDAPREARRKARAAAPPGLELGFGDFSNPNTNQFTVRDHNKTSAIPPDSELLRLLYELASHHLFPKKSGSEMAAGSPQNTRWGALLALLPLSGSKNSGAPDPLRTLLELVSRSTQASELVDRSRSKENKQSLTVADLLSALQSRDSDHARLLRQVLLAALAAIDIEE